MLTTAKPKGGFFIGVGCPGCGGELELEGDFFVTTCAHCGSVLRILMPDTPTAYMVRSVVSKSQLRFHLDRYLKKHDLPLTGSDLMIKRLYYPYWKVDATVLKVRNRTHKKVYTHVDPEGSSRDSVDYQNKTEISMSPYSITITAGTPVNGIPDSLGMRSEYIKATPFSSENLESGFDAMPVMRPWEKVRQRICLAVANMSMIDPADFGQNITRLFNPVFSLIYFPYFLIESYDDGYRRFVLDGLVGRVLSVGPVKNSQDEKTPRIENKTSQQLGKVGTFFESATPQPIFENFVHDTLARGVSHDLKTVDLGDDELPDEPPTVSFGQLDVDYHRCNNCGFDLPGVLSHMYICSNCHQMHVLEEMPFTLNEVKTATCDIDLSARLLPFWWFSFPEDEMKRLGLMFGTGSCPSRLVIPALRSGNFDAICRLARRMSTAEAKISMQTIEALDDRYLPVQVSLSEALAQAEMIVCREWVELGRKIPEGGIVLQPSDAGLFYVPFRLENYFYVDAVLHAVSVEKTLID